MPADSRASCIADASSDASTPSLAPSAICASASERASPILFSAARSARRANDSSASFAMQIVHVTSDANARPIITS